MHPGESALPKIMVLGRGERGVPCVRNHGRCVRQSPAAPAACLGHTSIVQGEGLTRQAWADIAIGGRLGSHRHARAACTAGGDPGAASPKCRAV